MLNERDIVPCCRERATQVVTYLAGAYNDNFHKPRNFHKEIVTYPMNVATKVSNLFSNSLIDLIIKCLQFVNLHSIQSFILAIVCLVNPEHVLSK